MKRSDELYAAQKAFRRGCKSTTVVTAVGKLRLQNWKINGTPEQRIDDAIAREIEAQIARENGGDE
jgi:hypothetical protein